MTDLSMKKSKKTKQIFDTSDLSEPTQIDSEVTFSVEPCSTTDGQECHIKKRKKHIKQEPIQDESFSVLNSKKKKVKKSETVEAIKENQSESFLNQINVEEMLETDNSDRDDTDKRKKTKLVREINKQVSAGISLVKSETKSGKKRKSLLNNENEENREKQLNIVKREVIDDDAVLSNSEDSEIVGKKSKSKRGSMEERKISKHPSMAHLLNGSSETNDEILLENVKMEPKRKKRRRQSCLPEEQQNGDSSLNSSLNDSKNDAKTFEYSPAKGPHMMFLTNNCFEVDFKVPSLHEILNRASKATEKQRNLVASLGLSVKHGKFTKQEDAQIRENWDYFIKVNGLENEPSNFFCLDKKRVPISSKKNFLFYLARNMPERIPLSVYQRFKILMQNVKTGRFTESEDETIREAIRQSTDRVNVTELAQTLQRSNQAIEKRVRLLKQDRPVRRIRWHEKNSTTFVKYLMRVTKTKDFEELQHRTVTADEWNRLSAKLDGYPSKSLKRVWFEMIYPSLFIPVDMIDVRQIKMALVDLMIQNGETDWKTIDWSRYEAHFPGLTSAKLYTLMRQLMKTFVPKSKWPNLKKCLKILRTKTVEEMASQTIFKMTYSDGKLQRVTKAKKVIRKVE